MDRTEISQTLEEIEGLRRDTRRALQSFWFPLVLFGAFSLVAGLLCQVGDGGSVAVFWAFAGPAGGISTAVYSTRREATLGLSRRAAPYIVVALGIMVGAFLLPVLTSGHLAEVVSHFAVAAGYLGFARIERDGRIAAIAALMAAVPLLMLAIAPESACAVTAAVTGSILLASGLSFRRTQAPVGWPPR
ncbi:MAG: hypothetical protein WKF43_12155 [Acidimicrobiales bacterium]